jgi:predicted phosphodiesterase
MTKYLVIGDTHADLSFVDTACRRATELGIDLIIQVGDWGFMWPNQDTIKLLRNTLKKHDKTMWFLDGNHDDHERLPHGAEKLYQISNRIYYLPRGYRFELDGVKCMSMGGAVSVDKPNRIPFISWWPNETIQMDDYETAIGGEDVDILFSHDAPPSDQLENWLTEVGFNLPDKMERDSLNSRQVVGSIVDNLNVKLVIHGHYHTAYTGQYKKATVIGLSNNNRSGSMYVLDTDNLGM